MEMNRKWKNKVGVIIIRYENSNSKKCKKVNDARHGYLGIY